jgi:hypothetical protein
LRVDAQINERVDELLHSWVEFALPIPLESAGRPQNIAPGVDRKTDPEAVPVLPWVVVVRVDL